MAKCESYMLIPLYQLATWLVIQLFLDDAENYRLRVCLFYCDFFFIIITFFEFMGVVQVDLGRTQVFSWL